MLFLLPYHIRLCIWHHVRHLRFTSELRFTSAFIWRNHHYVGIFHVRIQEIIFQLSTGNITSPLQFLGNTLWIINRKNLQKIHHQGHRYFLLVLGKEYNHVHINQSQPLPIDRDVIASWGCLQWKERENFYYRDVYYHMMYRRGVIDREWSRSRMRNSHHVYDIGWADITTGDKGTFLRQCVDTERIYHYR